jgi:dTDP-4-amino-4,6-dideoxygalactose transaminase
MNIPFSPPFINESVEQEVLESLRSGWITTGPKLKALEEEVETYTGAQACVCVNSWTSGAIMMLKWFGIGEGDEVIVPAYTYSATALAVLHCGAKPIMVDIGEDFVVNAERISKAITTKTKAVIPVDIGGWPVDYDTILEVLKENKHLFEAKNPRQKQLGRILLISDAAHSFGATYKDKYCNSADIIIYSFHAVKNLTTAEGGAIVLNLPQPFDNVSLKPELKRYALNGQSKDALAKAQAGNWRYDILELGFKYNMPDICAAIGLAQIRIYDKLLQERLRIFKQYYELFSKYEWVIFPPESDAIRTTSAHLYMLRIKDITEEERDQMIQYISEQGVSVNVHFIPMPMMSLFKDLGYHIADYPNTYNQYACEISLPIYPQLTDEQVKQVVDAVVESYLKIKA